MIRRAAAVVVALMLSPTLLSAQELVVLTVGVPSADVHKGPSTATPVIGHAPRGAVLPVARNLGSWVKVSWPDAQDGVGYVHVTMGRVGPPSARSIADPSAPPRSISANTPGTTWAPLPPRTPAGDQIAPHGQPILRPLPHTVGVGALVGSPASFGATTRVWRNKHVGFQFGLTRDVVTSEVAAGRVTSMQVEPGVVYSPFDRVTDYVWLRPYVGSVASFRHQTWSLAPASLESMSDNGLGFRVFGGSELMFAGLSRFGLSVDVGYRRVPTPFAGFEPDRLSATIAGHWYFK